MTDLVRIFDTTLRDGEQAPGASMTLDEKVRIARVLDALGVDVIEAGFPVSSPHQAEAVAAIAHAVRRPVVAALARTVEPDLRAAFEALRHAERARVHTFIATSDIHLAAKFDAPRYGHTLADKRRTILRMAVEAVAAARAFADAHGRADVEFSAEDAGRTDAGYLCEVFAAVVEAGATTLNIPDTTGFCLPHEVAKLFATVARCVPGVADGRIVLSAHCHDDLGLATANSLAAVAAGARQVECTLNGIGERAGNAALEEIVMAIRTRASALGVRTNVETRGLYDASRLVMGATGFPVQPNKAIVGRNAFAHEAGIHQHGVLKNRATYEIMNAADVGQDPEAGIRLGRHSGRAGLFARLARLHAGDGAPMFDPDTAGPGEADALYERFVALADRKKELYDTDLRHLLHATSSDTSPESMPAYQIHHLRVEIESGSAPRASVTIHEQHAATTRTESGTGDGPVSALYAAIDAATDQPHKLVSYALRSVSEGADAVGEVTVLIDHGGAFFRGVARHTDVLQASAQAYVEALNQLEAYRNDRNGVRFVGEGIMSAFGV